MPNVNHNPYPQLAGNVVTLAQFERAHVIRNVFFVAGRGPTLKVELRPVELDPSILQLNVDIDGQVLTYSHGPQVPRSVTWPGTAGSKSGVSCARSAASWTPASSPPS